jgi:hypothetical protein
VRIDGVDEHQFAAPIAVEVGRRHRFEGLPVEVLALAGLPPAFQPFRFLCNLRDRLSV